MAQARNYVGMRAATFVVWLTAILCTTVAQAAETAVPPEQQASASAEAAKKSAQAAAKSADGAASSAQAAASSASAASSPAALKEPPASFIVYGVPIVVLAASLFAISAIRKAVPSMAEALSEEVPITPIKDANGAVLLGKDDKPILLPEMKTSSSRVIALMGMVAILVMYIGFGVLALYTFAREGKLDNRLDGAISFLTAGLTLFAPYAVNKFTSMMK